MKRSLALLLILALSIATLIAKPILTIDESEIDKIDIFNAYGEKLHNANSLEDGYIVYAKDNIKAKMDVGEIDIAPESMIAITSIENRSAYLVFGSARIILDTSLSSPISIYTPTTLTKINEEGEYVFISLDDEEKFYNLSKESVSCYNALDGKSYEIKSLESINYLTRKNLISSVDKNTYEKISEKRTLYISPSIPSLSIARQEMFSGNTRKALIPVPRIDVEQTTTSDENQDMNLRTTRTIATAQGDILLIGDGNEIEIKYPESITREDMLASLNLLANKYSYTYDEDLIKVESISNQGNIDDIAATLASYFAHLNPTAGPSTESKASSIKSSITSSEKKRTFSFDVRLSTRAYTDSNNYQSLATSIIPEFSYGSFKLAFNLDPISLADYKANSNWQDWLGYSTNIIDALQYRTMDEVFSVTVDRTTKLSGDLLGLYDGVNHIWDKEYQPLALMMNIDTRHFVMDLYFNDLTFGRYAIKNNVNGVAGFNMGYIVSENIPVAFNVGMLINVDYTNASKLLLYPEAEFFIPFYSKGYNKAGLSFLFAYAMDVDKKLYSPSKSGFMFGAKIPLSINGFELSAGLYYTNPGEGTSQFPIHYRGINNPRYSNLEFPENDTVITLAGNIGYSGSFFGIDIAMLGDIRASNMKLIESNSLLEASTYLSFKGITLRAGISMQDFAKGEKYKENAKLYTGLDLDIGGVATSLKVGIDNIEDKNYFISYAAKASFLGKSEDKAVNPIKIPFSFGITTGYEYRYEDEASRYLIIPTMTIGKEGLALSLRAPLLLTFNTESKNFSLGGLGNGRTWWNFGSQEEGKKKVFYAITDAMQLINYISIGNPEKSVAYIDARRDFLMTDTLFTAFGADDALSLRAGFNFYNLSIRLYGGNIENPHIGELKIGIYPVNQDSVSLNLSIPSEFYIKDSENFDLYFYPEIKINLPLFKKHFNLAIYGVGSISALYENGEPVETNVIYDFKNNRMFSALLGGEVGIGFGSFSAKLQGGWRTGPLTPDMYNIFTSTYNQMPSKMNNDEDYDSSFFAKAVVDLNLKPVALELAYSVRDVEKLINDYKNINEDIFSLKMRVNFNDTISLYGAFHRKGFISLFKDGTKFEDVFTSSNTIYSLGMDFDYGIVSVNAEYSSLLKTSGYASSSDYVNINPEYISDTISSSFSVTTRIQF